MTQRIQKIYKQTINACSMASNKVLGLAHVHIVADLLRECTLSIKEGEAVGFYKCFKKHFVAPGTVELNISWSSNFFKKYFMAPSVNFSLAFNP